MYNKNIDSKKKFYYAMLVKSEVTAKRNVGLWWDILVGIQNTDPILL